ncbi:MAG: acyl-ACP--UDP-N-acetylglucosamine O-acyltransferase [bacterium]|nr:acyl-ACP--UDP-N-acetylglucosamine O-acyltransferase [bacterium]
MNIHPTAVVDPGAQIAEDVKIAPFVVVESDVVIDSGCEIGPHVLLATGARLGKNVRVFKGAVISEEPQDLKFKGGSTVAIIGDNTIIREFATIHRGSDATGKTIIGSDCLLMAYTHVAHDCIFGNKVILVNSANVAGHCKLEDWVTVGGLVPVHQFVRIGCHAFVGGGFRVVKDIPPFIMSGNEPLKFEGLNTVGLKRRGFTAERISQIKHAYRLIYLSDLNVSQGIARIREEMEITPDIEHIIDFIEHSERGII